MFRFLCPLVAVVVITLGDADGATTTLAPVGPSRWVERPIPPAQPSSYFILAPRNVRPGMDLELTVMVLSAASPVTVSATVNGSHYDRGRTRYEHVVSKTDIFAPGGKGILRVKLPENIPKHLYSFTLYVEGSGGLTFKHEESLYLRRKSISVFIQTDKSIYKPGQTVRMRVFAVDPNLKPYHGDFEIKIRDKSRNIIKHWKNLRSVSGVIQKELVLSDQPLLGSWAIEASAMGQVVRKNFEVKEYVLPKVEVEVDADQYMDVDQELMSGTIRAKYTYGKPVEGSVTITISHHQYYRRPGDTPTIRKIMTQLMDGRADFSQSLQALKELIPKPRNYQPDWDWEPSLQYTRFSIQATVTDKLTELSYQKEKLVNFRPSIYSISIVDSPRTYKQGSTYYAMVQVKNMNGDGLTEEDLYKDGRAEPLTVTAYYQDCYQHNGEYWYARERNHTLGADGFLRFQVDVVPGCESFRLKVRFRDTSTQSSSASKFKTRYTSGAFSLTFDDPGRRIMPGDDVVVNVQLADNPREYTYYILSKGAVVDWRTFPATQKQFTFRATTRMAPTATIIAWYTTENNEIISDSIAIKMGDIFENKVSLSFSTNRTQPARAVSLTVEAAPASFVALLAVDKSVLLLGDTHDITKTAVENEIKQYGGNRFPTLYDYCVRCWWPLPVDGQDPMSIFRNANVFVMTDGYIYQHGNLPDLTKTKTAGLPEADAASGERGQAGPAGPGVSASAGRQGSRGLQEPARVRSVFPETWIWADQVTDSNGRTTLQLTAPDTITSWVASAFALNDQQGLGVAGHRAQTTVFKEFFVSLSLPYSVIRYEEFVLKALVYNYMEMEQEVTVTLEQSMEFSVRKGGSDLGMQEAMNQELAETVTISAGEARAVYFWVVPDTLGNIKIQAKAQTMLAADAVRRTLLVEPEGVKRESTDSYLINLNATTNSFSRNLDIEFPAMTIEGSERVSVTAVGDMLSQSMNNLHHLIRMPSGCGEQNMVNFVPNIVALKYMNVTGRDNEVIRQRALFYMNTGYQRELTYKRNDGSYSAFGHRDRSGSLWLTAFVLKSFLQAKEFIYIDDNVIAQAARWLLRQQNTRRGQGDLGFFREPGEVLHSGMQGGSGSGAAMTAYTLIALSQENLKVAGQEVQLANAKRLAVQYLEGQLASLVDQPYKLAIITYALQLAGSSRAGEAFRLFNAMAVEKEGKRYWRTRMEMDDDKSSGYHRHQARALDIELNAYAVLIYLEKGMVGDSLPIAKWLLAQRNSYGGFSSTQDTVIALEALGQLAARLTTSSGQNIQVSLASSQAKYQLDPITRDNQLVLQQVDFPGKVTNITVDAWGQGLAVLQVAVHYNVDEDDIKPAVDMSVDARSDKDYMHLNICSSWTGDEESGMMVTEVGLLTGYSQEETNTELLERFHTRGVKRVENKDKNIVFYFDQMTREPVCVDVATKRTESVNKLKKAKVATYQYYSPDEQTIVRYHLNEDDADRDPCYVCPDCCTANQVARQVPPTPATMS